MNKRLAVITGGMGGLGETISVKMADAGYRVAVTYSPSNKTADKWLADMRGRGYDFHAYPVDVASYEDCAAKAGQIQKDCGHIDILVNNAGITRDMTFKKMTKNDWDAVMRTNLDSCFNMTKQVMDGMVERNWGRVINVASIAASQPGAYGSAVYNAAKAFVVGFTESVGRELAGTGVTANVLHPGDVKTEMWAAIRDEADRLGPAIAVDAVDGHGLHLAAVAQLHAVAAGPAGVVHDLDTGRAASANPLSRFAQMAYGSMDKLLRQPNIDRLLEIPVKEVRAMTGFDRVMAYRFRHDDSGDIVAEARREALEPFLGRRYPASDIPAQARRLYVLNTLRLIADVGYAPVPLLAAPGQAAPLDLSHSVLRSVSTSR